MKTRGIQKKIVGEVVSDRMEKTVVVVVRRLVRSPLYQKFVWKRSRYKAHDEKNECKVGDRVLLTETRPLSREKRWRVKEILEKAH
jgi:small subunit ribosomal protein S17